MFELNIKVFKDFFACRWKIFIAIAAFLFAIPWSALASQDVVTGPIVSSEAVSAITRPDEKLQEQDIPFIEATTDTRPLGNEKAQTQGENIINNKATNDNKMPLIDEKIQRQNIAGSEVTPAATPTDEKAQGQNITDSKATPAATPTDEKAQGQNIPDSKATPAATQPTDEKAQTQDQNIPDSKATPAATQPTDEKAQTQDQNIPDSEATPSATPPPYSDRLTRDWGGARTWLGERGITVRPRLTLFYQAMSGGSGNASSGLSGKADLLLNADLDKLGFWKGSSMTVHAEYNFGHSLNGSGGVMIPVNTALFFPGMENADAFDLSSVYFGQKFGDSTSLIFGKVNAIDLCSVKPFMGGAGIDSFWNCSFTAPPSGIIPPYLFGALLNVRTEPVSVNLWIFDPTSVVNKSCFDEPFAAGVAFRANLEFPVTIGGLKGHQGFTVTYSTEGGTEISTPDLIIPIPDPPTPNMKDLRYYFSYSFDQQIYQSKENQEEGIGIFGQFCITDGNPNAIYWSAFGGVGGKGLLLGRTHDNWGVGYYYDCWSPDLKNSLNNSIIPVHMQNEQGLEMFYNYNITPWFTVGADLQIIKPSLKDDTAVFPGLRTVIRF